MDEEDIYILVINETKLDIETSHEFISLDKFELRRKDCNMRGVG